MKLNKRFLAASLAALAIQLPFSVPALAQIEDGPITEKEYGIGLPRDHATTLFTDAQYPVFRAKTTSEGPITTLTAGA